MSAIFKPNLFILIFMLFTFSIETQALFKMTKIECTDSNASLVVVETCRLKAVKRDVVEATVKYRLLQKVHRAYLHVEMLRKYNTYEPFVINATLDLCTYFRNPKKSFLKILFKLIEKYTNANHTCPYENEIIIDRFRPELDKLVLPLPSADYLIIFGISTPHTLVTNLKVWFTFHEPDNWKRTFTRKDLMNL